MANQLFEALVTLALGTIIAIPLTYIVGGWFDNRKKRKRVIESLKIYLKSQHRLLNEHQRNFVFIDTKILDQFFVEGDLSLCSEEFILNYNHYYAWIKSYNRKYIADKASPEEIPEEYYKSLKQVNLSFRLTIEQELKPFYIKWKKRFDVWRKQRKGSSF